MMRRVISLSILLLTITSGMAQIKIGMKLSPQLTWASADNKNTSSNGIRLNASYGIMVDYYFTGNYAIGSEFCVNSYGANLNLSKNKYTNVVYNGTTGSGAAGDIKFDYRLQYFQIPVLLKMRTNETNSMRYYAEFGFGMGFLFRSKADISYDVTSIDNIDINNPDPTDDYQIHYATGSSTSSYSDNAAGFRGSLIFGAGMHYAMKGSSTLVAGLRFDNGMTSFTSEPKWSTSLSYLALNFGLIF